MDFGGHQEAVARAYRVMRRGPAPQRRGESHAARSVCRKRRNFVMNAQ